MSFRAPAGDEATGRANPELLKMHPSHGHDMTIINGISWIGYMSGGRDHLVEHAVSLSLRQDQWKLIQPSNRPKIK